MNTNPALADKLTVAPARGVFKQPLRPGTDQIAIISHVAMMMAYPPTNRASVLQQHFMSLRRSGDPTDRHLPEHRRQ